MKITGPTSGPPPLPPEDSRQVERTSAPAKPFSDQLAATSTTRPTLDSDLATALRAGKMNPSAAIEQVVERVLDRQLGANAPAAVREQVRAALRDALEGDPLLQEKVRRLGEC